MKEERFFYVPDAAKALELPEEEAKHAIRVLRLHEGDSIYLQDGDGTFYHALLTLVNNKHCYYDITESMPQERTWRGHIHLAIAPTKMMERIEWMVEKATEVGIDEISFLSCKFSERKVIRTDRIRKIVVAAFKQSRKAWMPTVNEMVPFHDFISRQRKGRKFICHCYNEIERADFFTAVNSGAIIGGDKSISDSTDANGSIVGNSSSTDAKDSIVGNSSSTEAKSSIASTNSAIGGYDFSADDITILVGPEGDFSIDEVREALADGYESVTLGTSRLRTETAGLSAVMMANLSRRR